MSDQLPCGHTEEEHTEMAQERDMDMAQALLQGDFSYLFQTMGTPILQTNLEAILMEMYLRSTSDEMFEAYFTEMVKEVTEILLPKEGEESTRPEIRDLALQARADVQNAVDDALFIDEATDELRVMLEQHGVGDDGQKERPDDLPGFYL